MTRYKRRDQDGVVHYLDLIRTRRGYWPKVRVALCDAPLLTSTAVGRSTAVTCVACVVITA